MVNAQTPGARCRGMMSKPLSGPGERQMDHVHTCETAEGFAWSRQGGPKSTEQRGPGILGAPLHRAPCFPDHHCDFHSIRTMESCLGALDWQTPRIQVPLWIIHRPQSHSIATPFKPQVATI